MDQSNQPQTRSTAAQVKAVTVAQTKAVAAAQDAAASALCCVQHMTLYLKHDCRKNFSGKMAHQVAIQVRDDLLLSHPPTNNSPDPETTDWAKLSSHQRLPWQLAAQLMAERTLPKPVHPVVLTEAQVTRLASCRRILASHVITRMMRAAAYRTIVSQVRVAANTVYQTMDWGWNEKVYQEALKKELDTLAGQFWTICSEIPHTISYRGLPLGDGVNVRTDIILTQRRWPGRRIILELKAVSEGRSAMQKAVQQCKRYITMLNIPVGMVINFPDRPSLRAKTQLVLRS